MMKFIKVKSAECGCTMRYVNIEKIACISKMEKNGHSIIHLAQLGDGGSHGIEVCESPDEILDLIKKADFEDEDLDDFEDDGFEDEDEDDGFEDDDF